MPVLVGAAIAQMTVLALYFASNVGFLGFNVIGCGIVVVVAVVEETRRALASRRGGAR